MKRSPERLTWDEQNKNGERRALVSMLSIVAINFIVLPAILWWAWFGFAVQSLGIIAVLVWQEIQARRDRNRTEWGKVDD